MKKNKREEKEAKKEEKAPTKGQIKKAQKAQAKEDAIAQARYEKDMLPIIGFDYEHGYGIMEDGSIIDCLRIESEDVNALDPQRAQMEHLLWDGVYKTYSNDLKIVSFNFPTETSVQQEYIDRIATRTDNPIYRELLIQEKEKLIEIHNYFMNKEYILFYFAKNQTEHDENFLQIVSRLTKTQPPLVTQLSPQKKEKIIYKLNNKNMNL